MSIIERDNFLALTQTLKMKKNMYLTLLIVAISALIPVYFSRDQEEVIFYGEEEIVAEIDDSGDDTVVIDDPLVEGISLEDTENPSNEEMKDPPVDDDHLQNSERTKEYKETPTLPQTETPQIDTPTEQETPLSREIEQNYSTTEFTRATCETTPLHIPGTTFVIASCNVGASVAGTSTDSYGAYFQRGNNYAFPRTGSSTVSNTPVIPEI
ncbi:hypothetical protein FACS189428_4580 [Clostridia bacterium]|nr:hypothetical protein FACS189428_4580 [Clostridia bacterium]